MTLNRERITLNPLEESLTNVPLELSGDRWGGGIFVQKGGAAYGPTATETPQVAQSVDTEGGNVVATTVGLRSSPVIKVQIIEPNDPADTNYVLDPQCTAIANYAAQNGAVVTQQLVRDLMGFDYAFLSSLPGVGANEGIGTVALNVPTQSVPYTAGVWLKGAAGGEAVAINLKEVGGASSVSNVTLTANWQWYPVSRPTWSTGTQAQIFVYAQSVTALGLYATGFALVQDTALGEFFDGTWPGCAWSGVAHASISTRPSTGGPRRDAIMADVERSVTAMSRRRTGTIRRTLPNGHRITFDVVNAQMQWDDTSMLNAGVATGTITFMCQPFGRGPELTTISDVFTPMVTGNYVADSGAISNFTTTAGLVSSGNLTTENRFINQTSQYPFYVGEVMGTFTPGATISGFKGGVLLKRVDAKNYIEAYVSDDGTNSFLKVDKVIAGTRTNVLTATLGARVVNGTLYTVRGRIQRQNNADNVYAEYFASGAVTNTTVPTNSLGPYAIVDAPLNALNPGSTGLVFTPQTVGAKMTALTISPYLARERTLPMLRMGLTGVPGTAPALGRMVVTDCANQDQFYLRWGQYSVSAANLSTTSDLFFEAESMTPQGQAASAAQSGASGGSIVRIAAGPNNLSMSNAPASMLQTTIGGVDLNHVGDFQVYARVGTPYNNSGFVFMALQWSVGDFQSWTTNTAIELMPNDGASNPGNQGYQIISLGTIHVPPNPTLGTWQGRILAYAAPAIAGTTEGYHSDGCWIDCMWLVPLADGAGQAVGIQNLTAPTSFVGRDEMDENFSTALSGRAAYIGGTWTTAGMAGDFVGTLGVAGVERTTNTDTTPRFAVLGTSQTAQVAQVDIALSGTNPSAQQGLILRYTDITHYFQVIMLADRVSGLGYLNAFILNGATGINPPVYTPTSGAVDNAAIGNNYQGVSYPTGQTGATPNFWYTLQAAVDTYGRFAIWWGVAGGTLTKIGAGYSKFLATGGALASGKAGFCDFASSGLTTNNRWYRNFWTATYTSDAAAYAGRNIEIRSDRAQRQNAAGTAGLVVPPSSYIGQYMKVPNPTVSDQVEQIAIKSSRTDVTFRHPDDWTSDAIQAQVNLTPRYANIPDA